MAIENKLFYYSFPMAKKKSLTRRISLRIKEDQWKRLEDVAENIALISRGQKPELSEIIRSIVGWGNKKLLTMEERTYISGDIPSLHGPHAPNKRNKP